MLRTLYLRNLAVVAEATIELGPGLNVLTGETGAGKSIVVDALALLAGARASSDLIRSGAETLEVTGVFEPAGGDWRAVLEEAGLPAESAELVIRREVSRSGRNRTFVDDRPATVALLARLAPGLVRIHTQREELGIVSPETQRAWLDASGGEAGREWLERTAERWAEYDAARARLERVSGDERLRLERIDLLRFQAGELDAAQPSAGEEEELRTERQVLRHGEAIGEALGTAFTVLFEEEGSAAERLSLAARRLEAVGEWEPGAPAWSRKLRELAIEVQELAGALRERLEQVEPDPRRLDEVEERLAQLERLFRKYGETSADLLAYRQQIGRELEELEGDAAQRDRLEEKVAAALAAYREAADGLSERRARWAESLAARVHRELADLAMGKARFETRLERRRDAASALRVAGEAVEFSSAGYDHVSYRLAANPGEEMTSLARGASGGELSRVYLALQLAVRGRAAAAATTMVFDEVDAGIGGAEAAVLGRKLQRLAAGGQILAVTHLPQVASHADRHFRVSKRTAAGRTKTTVEQLSPERQVEEVARMLAGREVTELSRSHARELIAAAEPGA